MENADKEKKRNILIGGAWPYANNSLHIGHIAGLISGDVMARYFRQIGDNVLYVSGTDCHGTPITIRAKKENKNPKEIAESYHKEFKKCFEDMQFSYDLYTKTEDEYHKEKVKELFKKMYNNGYIYAKKDLQPYCDKCSKFVADREVILKCPSCGNETKGDMCDCGYEPKEEDLLNAKCIECGNKVIAKENMNLYLALGNLQNQIEKYVESKKSNWRISSQNETEKYLREGLPEKAVTRNLEWGVDIPIKGFEDKKMYVWIEAVLGYVTACQKICEERNLNWEEFWKNNENNSIYMAHGKDNITFHTIILPALLLALDENYRLPDYMIATQYLNINSEKISKSKGNGITIRDMLDKYDSDMIRYYLIGNGPEKKDSNFSIEEFIATCNAEIVNKYGNLINRTLKYKGLETIPNGKMNVEFKNKIENAYIEVGRAIENLEFRKAIAIIRNLVEDGNKFYEEQQPWKQQKENIDNFNNTIYTCSNLVANLANLYEPFMPTSSKKVRDLLDINNASWKYIEVEKNKKINGVEPLFERIK